ncbi:hypothetical protein LPW11_17040 [Geomonas sp. RF6]|uniref:hypothetical protein n=1 Tax=Geomonas sp. RF6 TaxID=2897342 RepID=UPI001E5D11B4|nr:hypothetical protein [Geomonas sp. RF6]UFS69591.1 hypothetical protein LPW11_17040 [Geomonas sp. RF6]
MDVVINVLSIIYVLVVGVQLQGYLSHKKKGIAAERTMERYAAPEEGEASFS